jgi:hypothetical protein
MFVYLDAFPSRTFTVDGWAHLTAPLHIFIAAGGKFSFMSPSLVDLGRRRFEVPTASSVSSQGHSQIHHHRRIKKREVGSNVSEL